MLQHLSDKEPLREESTSSTRPPLLHDTPIKATVLPSLSGNIYIVIAAIIGTEFCERLCYYGVQSSLNLFLQNELGQSKAAASVNVAIFGGVCYFTPLIGGYIADAYLGRYYAILVFILFYLVGIIGIAVSAWILHLDHTDTPLQSERIFFWIALYLIALGTGGIKPNVSTLGAEQFESDEPRFSLKHNASNTEMTISELMPISYEHMVDDAPYDHDDDEDNNEMADDVEKMHTSMELATAKPHSRDVHNGETKKKGAEDASSSLIVDETQSNQLLSQQQKQKESFFSWFYFSINLGSFFAFTVIAYLCQNVNFAVGYSIPAGMLIIGIVIFVAASRFYRIAAAKGSIFMDVLRISCYGMKHGGLDQARIKYGNHQVEAVKYIVKLIPFLAFNVIYWCVYAQQSTLFYAQGCQMNISVTEHIQIPIATLGLFDIIPILILVPLFDKCCIPCLRKQGFRVTMLQRMGAGFLFAMLSMICAGVLEMYRKRLPIDSQVASACNSGDAENVIYITDLSIFWQIPQFVLIGVSEVLTSITGLEFFFSQSPPEMRSILASLNLVTTGFGSWLVGLFIMLVNSNKNDLWITDDLDNGHLDWYFLMIALFCLLTFMGFLCVATRYEYSTFEKDMLIEDVNKPNEDAIFEDILQTTPPNKRTQFKFTTPRQAKTAAKIF